MAAEFDPTPAQKLMKLRALSDAIVRVRSKTSRTVKEALELQQLLNDRAALMATMRHRII